MSITFVQIKNYARYQVRITRHNVQYSKTFSCSNGQKEAFLEAQEYETRLIEYLDTPILTSAGKQSKNPKPFEPRIEYDNKYGTEYVAVPYRRENGTWTAARRATRTHGLQRAMQLAIKEAKSRHIPHPNLIQRRKMPTPDDVREVLG